MIRQAIQSTSKSALRSFSFTPTRALSVSAARMAEGDTGATRSGGIAQGDSFSKREKATEDLFVRQKEREKLLAVKAKIAEQQKHLKELDKHISDLTKEQGGEQN